MEILYDFFCHSDIDYSYVYDNLHIFKWDSLHLEKFYDVIFIDSYEADISIYEKLSKKVNLTIAIDDYERINYPTKVIINFAAKADETFFKKEKKKGVFIRGGVYSY